MAWAKRVAALLSRAVDARVVTVTERDRGPAQLGVRVALRNRRPQVERWAVA